jgi:hypothetical protein
MKPELSMARTCQFIVLFKNVSGLYRTAAALQLLKGGS